MRRWFSASGAKANAHVFEFGASLETESMMELVLKAPHLDHTSLAHLGWLQAYHLQLKHFLLPLLQGAPVSVFPTMI